MTHKGVPAHLGEQQAMESQDAQTWLFQVLKVDTREKAHALKAEREENTAQWK